MRAKGAIAFQVRIEPKLDLKKYGKVRNTELQIYLSIN
jgi:hypothetical protein